MDLDNSFYQKWKKKTTVNKKFFSEKLDFCDNILNLDKLVSSFNSESQEKNQSDTFSLRLSESFIDETQESTKPKQIEEIIMISDSSSEESIMFDGNATIKLKSSKNIKSLDCICESFDDKFLKTSMQHASVIRTVEKINSISKVSVKEMNKLEVNVAEIDSENEVQKNKTNNSKIIKETVTENITLSAKKKKEILEWLSTNFDDSNNDDSCSLESAIPESRKSGFSSGNSSLERLELNFETPNNRDKFFKLNSNRKLNKKILTKSDQENIDSNSKKCLIEINKNRIPARNNSRNIPLNYLKGTRRKIILPDSDSLSSSTPINENTDKFSSDPIVIKRILVKSDCSNSMTSDSNPDKMFMNLKINSKIIIPESDSFGSNHYSALHIKDEKIKNGKKICETDFPSIDKLQNSNFISKSRDNKSFRNSIDHNFKIQDNQEKNLVKKKSRNTINDCADILENLYGADWKSKASSLISATEPKKQFTQKFVRGVQTEKKKNKKQYFDNQDFVSEDKKEKKTFEKNIPTILKKTKKIYKLQDGFSDNSSGESSQDCSYYTALSNPISLFKNYDLNFGTLSTIKVDNKSKSKFDICDSESDVDNWKYRNHQRRLSFDSSTGSSTSEFDPEDIVFPKKLTKKNKNIEPIKDKIVKKPDIMTKKSFLASLSKDVSLEEANFKAMVYRVKYDSLKEELCNVLYKLFNEKIFDNQLPNDMSIEWSVRLPRTAGKCYNRQSVKAFGKTVRSSRIVLATKVLDSPDRLRDTLIHEMCHAATWLINNISDGHGSFWRAWAHKATQVFPELPSISRCHNYEIQTKFTYKCSTCGYSIGRHSKSIDLNKKRCGYCHGIFQLLVNKVSKTGKIQKKVSSQVKEPSGFALFVKENYSSVRQSKPNVKHGEIMKILGQQFSALKITPRQDSSSKF